ncbi:hypothetical protein [Spongiimicrobium salis]|uniref:hypothetical protein n=1 Tax=Spongiimicrobium salis TaxID=1667022 RepID=UPI00374DF5D2
MKAIITLLFVIFLGIFSTQAQDTNRKTETKVNTITTTVVTTTTTLENTLNTFTPATKKNDNSVARLYMFKNSRVKKALSFKTKRSKSKLA